MDIRLLQTNPEDLISFYGGETLSQSGRSNVFAIETLAGGENTPMQIKLKCVGLGSIQLSDYTGGVIATITATDVLADVGGTVFYAVDDIATNMRNALLNITYIADNFSVEVFAGFDSTITPIIGDYVLITSKGFSYEEYWLQLSGGGASY